MHVRRPRECACSCFRCSCRHVAFGRHTLPTNPMFMPVYGNTHARRDERRACSRGTALHQRQRMHRHRCESACTKKNRCADATTRAKFRAMNTSPHALDATSTCASTQRAHDTHTRRDACMSVDDESMEHADRSVHRLAAGRMPRIVRSRTRRPDHGAPSTNLRIFISHARHGDRRMTWRAYR